MFSVFTEKLLSMTRRFLVSLLLVMTYAISFAAEKDFSAYLFAYFKGEGLAQGEQIYFAVSRDGLNWKDINGGNPVLTSTLGEKGLRDPFIMRSADGSKFFVIATDLKINGNGDWTAAQTTGSKSIMVWESSDLINWSEQRMCRVAPDGAGCTWAPEAVYNEESGEYLVFWSSKIPASQYVQNNDNTHRVYYSTTKDFKTFSDAKVWIELKNSQNRTISVIDATVIKVGNTYYRFKKNEATEAHKSGMPSSGKYIIMEKATSLLDQWSEVNTQMSQIAYVEGPTCFKFNGENKWCLFIDDFGGKGYYPLITTDLSSGVFTQLESSQYSLPSVMRHGSVVNITETEYNNLMSKYEPSSTSIIRINPAARQQTIEGWGVSLCWWANMCGKWSENKIDDLVDMLTSEDKLNYNIFRYNIGGGDHPSHYNGHMCNGKGKRAEMEGFKASEYSDYDWNADAAQRKVMLKLNEARKDAIFEAFSNSAPYWMTYSGCASGNKDAGKDNLKPEYYGKFSDYLIDVCKHYKDEYGIEFKTLDPFNEPNTNYWGENGGQEGCHFDPSSQVDLIRVIYPKLKNSGLKTVLSASDETSVSTAIGELQLFVKEGDIVPMLGQFNVHTYGGDIRDKANLKDLVTETRLPFWMSETGAGGNGLAGNLSLAQRMFDDLNYLQPQAWIDWQFVEENNDQWCMVKGNFSNQTYNIVKNFYVRMQVTRFIRQGYTMLGTGRNDILAAVSPSGDKVVVVMLNTATEEKNISIDLSLLKKADGLAELYVTNSRLDCKRMTDVEVVDGRVDYTMGGEEISTLVFATEAGNGMENFTEGFPYLIVPRASTAPLTLNGGALQLSSLCVADSMQRWYFNKLDNGNYNIYTMLEGRKYALTDDGSYYLTTSQLDESNKGQQFKVEHIGDNSYKVISVSNDKLLDLEGEHLEIGTKVGLWQTGATGANVHREWRILSVPFTAVPMSSETTVENTISRTTLVYTQNEQVIIISLDENVREDYSVYNINGQMLANGTVNSAITKIHLGRGIYIVKYGKEAQTVIVK